MRTTTKQCMRRTAAVAMLGALGAVTLGVGPASADTTEEQTVIVDLGDLDNAGTGLFDQFDPALGTLTSITIEADVSMSFDVCLTNLSEDGDAIVVPAGSASGEAVLTFAGGIVATASGSMPVPETTLQPSDGGDDCSVFESTGTPPSTPDSELISQSGVVDTFSFTTTDPDQLAPYVGTGTVSFDWAPTSASDINQPSEWTIVFLADGDGEARITYEYTPDNPPSPPPPTSTEETAPPPAPPSPPATCIPQGATVADDVSEADTEFCPISTTTELPSTGGPSPWPVALAGLLLVIGAVLLSMRRMAMR